MEEYRIFGPPGTGKSTILATKYIPDAIAKYGADAVMVTSFTRAAAAEIASKKSRETGRTIAVPQSMVGTLHSICYNALGCPNIIETDVKLIREWNMRHEPWAINGKNLGSIDEGGKDSYGANGSNHGDKVFNSIKILRNRISDKRFWSIEQIGFIEKWNEFKKETDSVDFTDLVELGIERLLHAPGNPKVIFVDEAQDFTRLQLKLIRSWAMDMDYIVLVGDDDQQLYSWAGTSSDAMIKPEIPAQNKRVLKQSYRVPRAILERATQMIQRVDTREPKVYLPRVDRKTGLTAEGLVEEHPANWREPDELIDHVLGKISQNKTCMILASCSFMITPIKKLLMENGIPFENRYRRTRADWNPLFRSEAKIERVDPGNLLLAFLGNGVDPPYWNVAQLVMWAQHLTTSDQGLKRKVGHAGIDALKAAIEAKEHGLHTTREVLSQIMTETAVERALARDVYWLQDNLKAARRSDTFNYMVRVHDKFGAAAIEEPPLVTTGTIHSVKGGEAQCVYLFPDISFQADNEMQNPDPEGRDAIYRMFYVGMTRASGQARMFVEL